MRKATAISRLIVVGVSSVFGCGAAAQDAASASPVASAAPTEASAPRAAAAQEGARTEAPSPDAAGASSAEAQGSDAAKPPPSGAGGAGASAGEAKQAPSVAGTVVLHIGDSFALAGFAQALKPRFKALGVRYEVRAETSSYTTSWAGRMEKLVADTQPDLVIINLGANEVENTDPPAHAPHVRRIVRAIGGRPCVWVSPPLWRKDTGITEVIRESSAPCRFFDSDALVTQPIPRQSDHIHPTPRGGEIWADAFWAWLSSERAPSPEGEKPVPWLLKPAPPEEHQPRPRSR